MLLVSLDFGGGNKFVFTENIMKRNTVIYGFQAQNKLGVVSEFRKV